MTLTAPSKYDPTTVPPSGLPGVSRFLIATTPSGVSLEPANTALLVWGNLLDGAQRNADPVIPETKTIALRRIVIDNGTYRVIDRGTISRRVDVKPSASGRFASVGDDDGGSLLDRVFLGERISGGIRPEVLWDAALTFAESAQLDGQGCRRLSDLCAVYLALQAGLLISPKDLP